MLLLSSSMSVFTGSIPIHDPATIKAEKQNNNKIKASFSQMEESRVR